MPTILQLRRGTAAQNAAYTGSVGELTVDTENTILRLHDGSTAGGTAVGSSGITPTFGNVKIGVTAAGEIDTSSGNLTIDSAGGTVTIDDDVTISGSLTVSGTTTTVNSTQVNIQNAFVFEGATADDHETTLTTIDPTADRTIKLPNVSGTIPVLAAESSTQLSATPAEINLVDGSSAGTIVNSKAVIYGSSGEVNATTLQIAGSAITSTAAELNILDGVTSTATELNIVDGDTSAGTTAVAGSDGIVTNDAGTMRQTTVDTFDTYLAATSKTLTNKGIALGSNTVSGTTAQFNSALSDGTFVTTAGSETLTNKTLTTPVIASFNQTSGSNLLTAPAATDTLVGRATTDTLTNKTISGADNTLSNIGNSSLSNSTITASDGSNSTAIALGGTLTFAGTTNEVTVAESSGTVTIGLPDNVTISGNLTVSGDTTTVNTATLAVEDPLINLATGNNSSDAVDIGFYGLYDTSGSQDLYAGLFRDAGDGKFKLFKDNQAAPTTTVNTSGTGYAVATLVANLEATTATLGGSDIISTDNTKTLTNKTIAAGNNTLSGITSSHFASAVTLVINDSSGSAVKTIVGSAS